MKNKEPKNITQTKQQQQQMGGDDAQSEQMKTVGLSK